MWKLIKNFKGFSIAEVMIAVGMLGVVSLGVTKMISMMTQGQKKLAQDFEANQIIYHVTTILHDKVACKSTFQGKAVDGSAAAEVDVLINGAGTTMLTKNQLIGENTQGKAELIRMWLENFTPSGGADPTFGTVDFYLLFEKKSVGQQLGGTQMRRKIRVAVRIDGGTNLVTECRTEDHAYNAAMCAALGGHWNDSAMRCESIEINALNGTEAAVKAIGLPTAATPVPAVKAEGAITATHTISSDASITAGTFITAGTDISSTSGNIIVTGAAPRGNITARGDITATDGNITASDNDSIVSGGNVKATGGGVVTPVSPANGNGVVSGQYVYAQTGMFVGTSVPAHPSNQRQLVTAEWVAQAIGQYFAADLDSGQRTDIYNKILQGAETEGVQNILKMAFASAGKACAAGAGYVKSVTLNGGYQWNVECAVNPQPTVTPGSYPDSVGDPGGAADCIWINGTTTCSATLDNPGENCNGKYLALSCPASHPILSGIVIKNRTAGGIPQTPLKRCCKIPSP